MNPLWTDDPLFADRDHARAATLHRKRRKQTGNDLGCLGVILLAVLAVGLVIGYACGRDDRLLLRQEARQEADFRLTGASVEVRE